jgi:hypothetical protein
MDPVYIFISFIGLILVLVPQMLVKSTYSKFAKVRTSRNMTGADVAKSILNNAGIYDINVEPVSGELTDHYDPSKKVIRLSDDIFYGSSISSFGIAAHEVGHAIQDNKGYIPMRLRAGIFPAAQIGPYIGSLLVMAGLGLRFGLGLTGFSDMIALTGIILYAAAVLFHIVTLPVEFDASMRAVKVLADGGYLVSREEVGGAKQVLTAAALTYVAAALYALIELFYWIWVYFGNRRD